MASWIRSSHRPKGMALSRCGWSPRCWRRPLVVGIPKARILSGPEGFSAPPDLAAQIRVGLDLESSHSFHHSPDCNRSPAMFPCHPGAILESSDIINRRPPRDALAMSALPSVRPSHESSGVLGSPMRVGLPALLLAGQLSLI